MTAPRARDELAGLQRDLSVLAVDGPSVSRWLAPRMEALFGSEAVLVYTAARSDTGHQMGHFALSGIGATREGHLRGGLDGHMRTSDAAYSMYDPGKVDALQRNRAVIAGSVRSINEDRLPAALARAIPSKRERQRRMDIFHRGHWWFEDWGVVDADNLRVLLCDGPRMVGYVGVVQHECFTERDRRRLAALIPAMRRRFILEERIRTSPTSDPLVTALLEEIAGAAYLLDRKHRVVACNSAARQQLARDRGRHEVLGRIAARGGDPTLTLVDLTSRGVPDLRLLIERPAIRPDPGALAVLAVRYALTPRERQVTELLGQGLTNRAIAVALSCGDRTVETHVSRVLEKTDCASRSELVALLWSSR